MMKDSRGLTATDIWMLGFWWVMLILVMFVALDKLDTIIDLLSVATAEATHAD